VKVWEPEVMEGMLKTESPVAETGEVKRGVPLSSRVVAVSCFGVMVRARVELRAALWVSSPA
jgi:hypothetical protein